MIDTPPASKSELRYFKRRTKRERFFSKIYLDILKFNFEWDFVLLLTFSLFSWLRCNFTHNQGIIFTFLCSHKKDVLHSLEFFMNLHVFGYSDHNLMIFGPTDVCLPAFLSVCWTNFVVIVTKEQLHRSAQKCIFSWAFTWAGVD